MHDRAGGTRHRVASAVVGATVLAMAFAGTAQANNLDRQTAQNAAKFAAKKECQATSGCTGFGASNVVLLTHHKANGKIFVNSTKNGQRFQCRQQVVIRLDHETGDIRYTASRRRCTALGPA